MVKKTLTDPAWRVREMAAKVAAKHQLRDLLSPLERLRDNDPNQRVVAASERAITRIIAANT